MNLCRRYVQGLYHRRLLVLVVAASAAGVVYTSKDLLLTPIAGATLAGLVVVALGRLWKHDRLASWKHLRTAQFASLAAVPVVFSAGLSVNSDYAFRQAFNTSAAPPAVHDLTIDANIVSPGGKRVVLMRFNAAPGTFDWLLAAGAFEPDRQVEQAFAEHEGWLAVLRLAFNENGRFGGRPWSQIASPAHPVFRKWLRTEHGTRVETKLVLDLDTGRAHVLYTVD